MWRANGGGGGLMSHDIDNSCLSLLGRSHLGHCGGSGGDDGGGGGPGGSGYHHDGTELNWFWSRA